MLVNSSIGSFVAHALAPTAAPGWVLRYVGLECMSCGTC